MKKSRYLIMSVLLVCLSAAMLLCACGGTPASAGGERPSVSEGGGLVLDKKYVRSGSEEGMQNYFLFRADGTGEYSRYYVPSSPYVEHYVVRFKYFYADKDQSAVACFFDSVEYSGDHKAAGVYGDTVYLLTVSEHVLTGERGYFINEDDIGKLPNYDKD